MRKRASLPDENFISRLCYESTLDEDGKPTGESFELRVLRGKQEEYLSVNWLERLHATDRNLQITEVLNILRKKIMKEVKDNDLISVMNVGKVKIDVLSGTKNTFAVRILHEGGSDKSHSGIYDTEAVDSIREIIAASVLENYEVIAIDSLGIS